MCQEKELEQEPVGRHGAATSVGRRVTRFKTCPWEKANADSGEEEDNVLSMLSDTLYWGNIEKVSYEEEEQEKKRKEEGSPKTGPYSRPRSGRNL